MADQPEINLWMAVIEQAIGDLDDPAERGGALDWLRDPQDAIGTFQWIAFLMDMDPRTLLSRVLARDKARRMVTRRVARAPKRFRWMMPASAA